MRLIGSLVTAILLVSCSAQSSPNPEFDARLANAAETPQDWLTYGGTQDEQRFSRLTAINTKNVSELGLAWSHEFDTARGQEATPLVADGVLYTTTAWSKVYAFEAETGKPLWNYDPKVPGETGFKACCDVVNRGVALYDGKVFVGGYFQRPLECGGGRVVDRADQARDVARRRRLAASFGERPARLAFEVDDENIVLDDQYLPEMEIAMVADFQTVVPGRKQCAEAFTQRGALRQCLIDELTVSFL